MKSTCCDQHAGYTAGCEPCRARARKYEATRQLERLRGQAPRLIDATGTRRRMQALYRLGWDWTTLGRDYLGMSTANVAKLARRDLVFRSTAAKVATLYDRLCMTPGPTKRAVNTAIKYGWPPPMAYDDSDIDNPDPEIDDMAKGNAGYTRWMPFEERFWGRVAKTETCWLWTGRLTEKGYAGKVGYQGKHYAPHRLAYELLTGPIPDGLVLDHLCRVRNCVNPDHLEPVTAEENTRRGTDARWLENCPNGHPAPLYRRALPSGKNVCVECRRISDKARDERHREKRRAAARARYTRRLEQPDEVVVERLMNGQAVRATRAERREAARRLTEQGHTVTSVAVLLHVSGTTARDLIADAAQEVAA